MPNRYIVIIFVCLLAVLFGSAACHNAAAKQDTTAAEHENNLGTDNQKNNQNSTMPDNQNSMPAPKQNKWKFYFQESANPEIMKQFEKAHQIVLQSEHPEGKLEDASEHLNNWFILRYPKQDAKHPQATDISVSNAPVYIVNLDDGKMTARGDVQAILPIYQLLLQDILDNPTKKERYIKRMAVLTSIAAFGHERYNEPTLDFVPETPDTATLRYEINPTDSSIIQKHCELVINKNTVELHVSEQPQDE